VGMDHGKHEPIVTKERIPHTRGDGPSGDSTSIALLMYSPHAWGWTAWGKKLVWDY